MHRIILDTDLAMGAPGSDIDDGFAFALAHADDDLHVDLVTTVGGNTDVESATLLTLELRRRLGIDVPVYRGARAPLCHPERVGRPSAEVAALVEPGAAADAGYAAVEMVRHVLAHPGEITLVAIGPLTNVATAIALEPRFASALREIVIMGGVFGGTTGRADRPGEFNVWHDPEAAEAVLRSGARQRWVGLDVTLQVRLTVRHAERLRQSPGDFAPFAGESTLAWIDHLRRRNPPIPSDRDWCAMHDPLAVAVVAHPELVTWQDAAVSVVTGDGVARGVMVADLLTTADAPAPNCTIATAVDADAFTEYFLASLATL